MHFSAFNIPSLWQPTIRKHCQRESKSLYITFYMLSGMQLEIFEGRGSTPSKGVLFIRRYSLWIFFQIHKWRKYCGKFTDIVALKCNESYCNSSLGQGDKKGARGEAPEYCGDYDLKENLFDMERALQRGHFCSFAEKGRVLDPQDPPSCAPSY